MRWVIQELWKLLLYLRKRTPHDLWQWRKLCEVDPYDNPTSSGKTDGNQRNFIFLKKVKELLNLAAWNVRTTNDSDTITRPERSTAIICKELEKAFIDICALSEVRHPASRYIKERSNTIFWSGGEDRTAGVGFAISNKLSSCKQQINDGSGSSHVERLIPSSRKSCEP